MKQTQTEIKLIFIWMASRLHMMQWLQEFERIKRREQNKQNKKKQIINEKK